jgi:hypothetical protein
VDEEKEMCTIMRWEIVLVLDESSSPKEEVLSALGNSVNSSSGNESTLDDSSLKVDGLV